MASRRLLRSLKIAKGIALVTVGVLFRLSGDMAFGGEH